MKQQFELPQQQIYLVGNSLGAMPKAVSAHMRCVVDQQWGQGRVSSWNDAGWVDLPTRVGDKLARLIGAQPGEVVAADSTSINLYKLIHQALTLRPGRHEIVIEQDAFPTDAYIAQGIAQSQGLRLRSCPADKIGEAIGPDTAVVVLGHVNYRTGRCWDMPHWTARIHQAGALALWDVAHSAGALPLQLNACEVDFAVGCGYKYLNGGPGAPAFAYVAQRHHAQLSPILQGWFGHARPFDFEPQYQPAKDAGALQVGTPAILSLSALDAALDAFATVDLADLHERAQDMLDTLVHAFAYRSALSAFQLLTPTDRSQRGQQLSFCHPQAHAIGNALIAHGVTGDFRPPDILRWGVAPLYIEPDDIEQALATLERIMQDEAWRDARFQTRKTVT